MNDLKLYQLDDAAQAVLDGLYYCDEETGEILYDPTSLEELRMDVTRKLNGCAHAVVKIEGDIAKDEAMIKILTEHRDMKERERKDLEAYIARHLESIGGKLDLPGVAYRIRKGSSESVDIMDAEVIPREYFRVKTIEEPDKKAIREAIKSGKHVPGAAILKTPWRKLVRNS